MLCRRCFIPSHVSAPHSTFTHAYTTGIHATFLLVVGTLHEPSFDTSQSTSCHHVIMYNGHQHKPGSVKQPTSYPFLRGDAAEDLMPSVQCYPHIYRRSEEDPAKEDVKVIPMCM